MGEYRGAQRGRRRGCRKSSPILPGGGCGVRRGGDGDCAAVGGCSGPGEGARPVGNSGDNARSPPSFRLACRMTRDEVRFWSKVGVPDTSGCLLWKAGRTCAGYGAFYVRRRNLHAHTWIYQVLVEPIPKGQELDHLCGRKTCVNVEHLELVSHGENVRRWFRKITHCPQGHPYTQETTEVYRGHRYCLTCRGRRVMRLH